MANKVLDSWALVAFFEDEPAASQVEEVLDQASTTARVRIAKAG
jgi:PIN domain nuclease of toxin-antitoxin system